MTKQQDSKDTDLDAVNRFFMAQCNTCGALFASKNREYDNAIVRTGVLGAVVEITEQLQDFLLWCYALQSTGVRAKPSLFGCADGYPQLRNYCAATYSRQ